MYMMLDESEDHRVPPDAIRNDKDTYTTKQGIIRKKRTTKGWNLLA